MLVDTESAVNEWAITAKSFSNIHSLFHFGPIHFLLVHHKFWESWKVNTVIKTLKGLYFSNGWVGYLREVCGCESPVRGGPNKDMALENGSIRGLIF